MEPLCKGDIIFKLVFFPRAKLSILARNNTFLSSIGPLGHSRLQNNLERKLRQQRLGAKLCTDSAKIDALNKKYLEQFLGIYS